MLIVVLFDLRFPHEFYWPLADLTRTQLGMPGNEASLGVAMPLPACAQAWENRSFRAGSRKLCILCVFTEHSR